MKQKNRTYAYCVAKYGPKWVKTRTIIDSLSPKWNEQYTWEVYDPCTVITIVVFDNGKLHSLLSAYKPAHTRSQEDGRNSIGCEVFLFIFVKCFANLCTTFVSKDALCRYFSWIV